MPPVKVAAKGISLIVIVILSALGFGSLFATQTLTATFYPIADSYTYISAPSTNYGSMSYGISAKSGANPSAYFYMMFDLSGLPPGAQITDLRLSTYIKQVNLKGTFSVTRVLATSNTWTEGGLNWNNQPGLAAGAPQYSYLQSAGWKDWQIGFYRTYANAQFNSYDKKVTFVFSPDRTSGTSEYSSVWVSSREDGDNKPRLYVTYTFNVWVLRMHTRWDNGQSIAGVTLKWDDFPGNDVTTDGSGLWSGTLPEYTYRVTAVYQGLEQKQTITLTSDMDVYFTFTSPTPTPTPAPYTTPTPSPGGGGGSTFTVQYTVQDQLGHALPAKISETSTYPFVGTRPSFVTDTPVDSTTGRLSRTFTTQDTSFTMTAVAKVQVGNQSYQSADTFTVDRNLVRTITINRRFYWHCYLNYSDGTKPLSGTLTFSSTGEKVEVNVINGEAEAYLLDGTYKVSFTASPTVDITTISVDNDGTLYIKNLNKDSTSSTGVSTTTATSDTNVFGGTAGLPFYLIPDFYIYALLGVLALAVIVAGVVALRRRK